MRTIERAQPITLLGTERPSRHDLGDVQALAASMTFEGQRFPVLLLPSGEVLKGTRRIAAAALLGWTTILVKQVDTVEDAVEAILSQRDDMTMPRRLSEAVELGMTLEILDRRERGEKGTRLYDTHQVIGPAVTTSGSTYKRARFVLMTARSQHRAAHVVEVAQDALEQIEAGSLLVSTAYNRVRAAERADPIDGLGQDGLPMIAPPQGQARSAKARKLREDWIKALAAKGATSDQIAVQLGLSGGGLRKIVHDMGITIPADVALNKTQRRAADPNRAMRVATSDLDALVWSLERMEPADLDPIEAAVWAQQLKDHARAIERVSRRITKEHVR